MIRLTDEEIREAIGSVVDQAYVKGCPNSPQEWFVSTEKLIPLQNKAIATAQLKNIEDWLRTLLDDPELQEHKGVIGFIGLTLRGERLKDA